MNSLKYLRSAILGSKDKGIRKSEFVATTNFFPSFCREFSKFEKQLKYDKPVNYLV